MAKDEKVNILFLNKFREIGGSEIFLTEILKELDRDKFKELQIKIFYKKIKEKYKLPDRFV